MIWNNSISMCLSLSPWLCKIMMYAFHIHLCFLLLGVPYSEHSSYSELKEFVQFLRPGHVVSTVGGASARKAAESQCRKWMNEKKYEGKKQISIDSMFSKVNS